MTLQQELLINTNFIDSDLKPYYINGIKSSYYVSKNAEVINTKNNKIKFMKPQCQKNGYYLVHLHLNGKSYFRWLHRMVAECFIDNPENKPEVNHKDGNKSHNYMSNLEWVTTKENIEHAFKTNLRGYGEKSSNTKIRKKDVITICEMLEDNQLTMTEIADYIGCSYSIVFMIKSKKCWVDISKNYNFENYNAFSKNRGKNKLTESDVIEICELIKSDKITCRDIAKLYNVFEATIYRIKSCKTWKDITSQYNFQ